MTAAFLLLLGIPAQSFAGSNGIVVYDPNRLGAEFAQFIEFAECRQFPASITVILPNRTTRSIYRDRVVEIIYFPDPLVFQETAAYFNLAEEERQQLLGFAKKYPKLTTVLNKEANALSFKMQNNKVGIKLMDGEWVGGPVNAPLQLQTDTPQMQVAVASSVLEPKGAPVITDRSWTPKTADEVAQCSLIVITDRGQGSAFLCHEGDYTYIYTNIHVLTAANQVRFVDRMGTEYKDIVDVETAGKPFANGDVVRLRLQSQRPKALRMAPEDSVALAGKILIFGNSTGKGVITQLDGEIKGLGPGNLEVSSPIVPGNSGGPIVDAQTLEVIGISYYAIAGDESVWTKDTPFAEVRRFGLRPAQIRGWDRMHLSDLLNHGYHFAQLEENIRIMAILKFADYSLTGIRFDRDLPLSGDYTVGMVLDRHAGNPILRQIQLLNETLAAAIAQERFTVKLAMNSYITQLTRAGVTVANQRRAYKTEPWSWYHVNAAEKMQLFEYHIALESDLEQEIRELRRRAE